MLAKTTGAILFGIVNAFVPVVFALFLVDLSGVNWLQAIMSVVLTAVTSTFLGLFIAVSVSEVFEAQTLSNFFRFPMVFLCGLFIPVKELPLILRPFSYAAPLTYGTDILKSAINGNGHMSPFISFLALIGFSLALFVLSTGNIKKKWIY